jgi:hypothetical protein
MERSFENRIESFFSHPKMSYKPSPALSALTDNNPAGLVDREKYNFPL